MNDRHSSSISWRHLTMPWSWTSSRQTSDDADRHLAIHVSSTLGRLLPPRSCVIAGPRLPLPPPLLPLAGLRRTPVFDADIKLERVPTPIRADQLLVDRGEEHQITVCLPRHSGSGVAEVEEKVKHAILPDDCDDLEADSDVVSYRQRSPVDVSEAASTTNADSDNFRQPVLGDCTTAARHVPDKHSERPVQLPGTGADDVDGNHLPQSTEDYFRASVVRRRLLSAPRCGWPSVSAVQRRAVELDAKYWERRRKNNEAAKRSRDIRRANERRVALRAALLEKENERLRAEVDTLTDDALRLHYYLLCSRTFACTQCHRSPNE